MQKTKANDTKSLV